MYAYYPGEQGGLCPAFAPKTFFTGVRECLRQNYRLGSDFSPPLSCGNVCATGQQAIGNICLTAGTAIEGAASCPEILERPDPDWDGTGTQTCVCFEGFFRPPSGPNVGTCVPRTGWVRLGSATCSPDQLLIPNAAGTDGTCFNRNGGIPGTKAVCEILGGYEVTQPSSQRNRCRGIFTDAETHNCPFGNGCASEFRRMIDCHEENGRLSHRYNAGQTCRNHCPDGQQAVGQDCRSLANIAPGCGSDEFPDGASCTRYTADDRALIAEVEKATVGVSNVAAISMSVSSLLAAGANPNAATGDGVPLLAFAAANLQPGLVHALITEGTGVDISVRHTGEESKPIPHLMTVPGCAGGGNSRVPSRDWIKARDVLRAFAEAVDAAGLTYDYNARTYGGLPPMSYLPWRHGACTTENGAIRSDWQAAMVEMGAIMRSRDGVCSGITGNAAQNTGLYHITCDGD